MYDGQRAIAEAELLLLQLARNKGGLCRTCAARPRLVVIWDGVADSNPEPCVACGWTPLVVDVVYGDAPLMRWAT